MDKQDLMYLKMKTICKKNHSVSWAMGFARLAYFATSIFAVSSCADKSSNNLNPLIDNGLRIGWSTTDITPKGSVSLYGQYYERISQYVQSPLKATACAIESIKPDGSREQAIMVSLDLLCPSQLLQDSVRSLVKNEIPDFNVQKLFLNATHTHSAPDPADQKYHGLFLKQISKAVVEAWKNRKPAGISRAVGYAVVGHNRRVEYASGKTEMYGATDRNDFMGMEGGDNPGVDMLFCWDLDRHLIGMIMNVTCPSQVTESKYYVSADYWGELRKELAKRFRGEIPILTQCGAAGDLSPRDLPRGYKSGEPNMWDVPGTVEIGKRLMRVVDEAYDLARTSVQTDVPFTHLVEAYNLPSRRYSKMQYLEAQKIVNEILSREPKDPDSPDTAWNRFLKETHDNEKTKAFGPWDNKNSDFGVLKPCEAIMEYYRNQDQKPFYKVELHVIRLGDVAIATNPFELYLEYGRRMMSRSMAKQTLVVQLSSGDYGSYLPTERAVRGGGYSAQITPVGPEGGTALVNETVRLINSLWNK